MAVFEQTPSRSGSRFGKLSSNMFFTRNTAQPKRVRHIEGLNGALICSVNDDPSVARSSSNSALDFNKNNLPSFEASRRAERLLPPTGFWNTYGVIQDTDRWRHELASLANASGLGIEKEEQKYSNKPTTADQQNASRSGAHYSIRTGRFNEGTAKSRGRTGSKHGTAHSDMLFNVPENERELWMLQVLCQILGTSNLDHVQSWLVSASPSEKEQARTMINSALQGFKESERTSNQSPQQPVDFDSLSNFVEKQKNEEKHASQKYIKESFNRPLPALQSINEEQQQPDNNLDDSWTNLVTNNPFNTTTYKTAFQNYNQRSFSSFDITNNKKDEQIDPIQVDENHQPRARSASLTKLPKSQTPLKRSASNHQQKHHVESLQLTDDDDQSNIETEEQQQNKPIVLPRIQKKKVLNQDDKAKSRKIRELQNKLSRQEEEAKKQLNELQSKQSRLENALKLLVKQTSSYRKRRQSNLDEKEIPGEPVVNPINHHRNSSDNRLTRSLSCVLKPDQSTLPRLPEN